jgi:hypothetical protein
MELSEIAPSSLRPGAGAEAHLRCDRCGVAVAADQRHCVVCGEHLRNVNDPAARYLGQATARSRMRAGAAVRRSRAPDFARVVVLVAILLAVAVGVLIGRGSAGGDASRQNSAEQQLRGEPAARKQLSRSAHVVSTIQQSSGSGYVNSQRGLPNQVSVP